MNPEEVTPLILTFNEEANLQRCLERLNWASRIVVLDSGSQDKTREIASSYPHVCWYERDFDNHTSQWNHGLSLVNTRWVLTLDADYVCPLDFPSCLTRFDESVEVVFAHFRYLIMGYPLRGSLYPPRAVLFPARQFSYEADGHTQLLRVPLRESGRQTSMMIDHDDRKSLSRWFRNQQNYAALEAHKILSADRPALSFKDRIRSWMIVAPLLTPVYCLLYRRLILDGWPGVYYTLQRTFAELLLSLELLDRIQRQRCEAQPTVRSI